MCKQETHGGYISEITLNDGKAISIKENDIVVFVGSNNVGKSQCLKDIYEITNEKIDQLLFQILIYIL